MTGSRPPRGPKPRRLDDEPSVPIDLASARDASRRAHDRKPLHADIVVLSPSRAEGVVLNASSGGLRVALDRAVYVKDELWVELRPAEGDPVKLRARVVWVRELKDGWLAGLERVKSTE